MKKTANQTAKRSGKSRQKSLFKPGGAQGPGRGPEKGAPNAGRPPDKFKELCRELATGEKTVAQIRLILKSKKDPQFMAALRWASEHGYGKPAQPLEHNAGESLAAILLGQRE